jgi:metal-responsive CopG/Arc/MetJ family transcriptional regulator
MKTAISVRDNLFERVDQFARKRNLSRSRVFSDAAEEYLKRQEEEDITANLNEVYSKEDSSVDPVMLRMALMSIPREEW